MVSSAIVLRGDARNLPLPDASVDLIVTSPPYFGLRSYTDGGEHYGGQIGSEATPQEWLAALVACTAEWVRVLKPSGSIFVNLGDKYAQSAAQWGGSRRGHQGALAGTKADEAARFGQTCAAGAPAMGTPKSLLGLPWRYAIAATDQLGLILRRDIIWSKPNGLPESVTDRCRSSHEYLFHLVKQPRYYAAVDEIREPHVIGNGGRQRAALRGTFDYAERSHDYGAATAARAATGQEQKQDGLHSSGYNPLGKLPGSVWDIPSQPLTVPDRLGVDHFAAFPTELPKRCILGWSPPGGVVLDPFGGTGTTSLVASVLGRTGITVDRSADYCRLARWRTQDPGERCRVIGAPKPPPVLDGQDALFGA